MGEELAFMDDMDGPEGDALISAAAKHSARYTKERNPRLYRAIQMAWEWGVSQNEIVKELNVSHNLVSAIIEASAPVSLDTHKREIIASLRRAGRGILRRINEIIENGEEVTLKDLGVVFGILTEKELLLDGKVTHRVGREESPEEIAFRQLLLSQANKTPARMDSTAREFRPNGPVIDVPTSDDGSGDYESHDD
jgi:cell division protein ZapA (FtsZ GTPase activity inhibitor)